MKKIIYIFISFITFTSFSFPQTGSIKGNVSDKDSPIAGVSVSIINTGLGAVSDLNGNYFVADIPFGRYKVKFSVIGYLTDTLDIQITTNKTFELNVVLRETIIEVSEVEIIGNRVQRQRDTRVSLLSLKPSSARVLPGAIQDVLRALQSLPGVLAINDFSSQLVIRGSGPDQNLIVMDDIEVFSPYRLYGVISMFNPEAVSDISLITGGFPARYGDRLSAVLDVTNKEGTKNNLFKGNINASIVSANLVLEGKNPFNIKGSWLFNSRRTYYDLIIEPFVKKAGLVEDNVAFPNFYDFQAKLTFGPFSGHRFLLNGILSRDAVHVVSGAKRVTPDSVAIQDQTKNDLAGFAWHYSPTQKFLNKVILSWYRNGGDSGLDAEVLDPSIDRDRFKGAIPDTLAAYLVGFGFNSTYAYRKYSIDDKFIINWGSNEFEAGAGYDLMQTTIDLNFKLSPEFRAVLVNNPSFRAAFSSLKDVKDYSRSRFYVQNNFKVSQNLFLQPGLRFDYSGILDKYYIAPRFSFSYAFNNITTLRAVWGIYYQSPGYEKMRDAYVLFDLSEKNTKTLQAEKATHYVLSLERWLSEEWHAKFETYFKKFDDLIVQKRIVGTKFFTESIPGKDLRFKDAWTSPVPIRADSTTQVPVNNSNGEAYGFEFLLEKKNVVGSNILSGWISYTLAWANRYEENYNFPFRFDQRHTINIVLDYQANNWLTIGLRFQFGSGFPVTQAIGIKPRVILKDENADGISETPEIVTVRNYSDPSTGPVVVYDIDYGGRENYFKSRKPDYHRLDLRFTAATNFWGYDWNFYLDVINVYNRTNVINYDYFVTPDLKLGKRATGMFPILPTFGFNVKF
ncbi:MAG: TonB-dependent receptor [Ignavibacteriales bacterium]|nr:TonB-dependent receptor [Ignavibacteriales bacterium]